MPVPASITELSTTASNNSPAGSESPTTTDDYLRTLSAFVATLRDGKQPLDAMLTAIAALSTDIGKFLAFSGPDAPVSRSIVGTVSESLGVPTGSIIQRISNANGRATRYADGWQVCTLRGSPELCDVTSLMGTSGFGRTAQLTWTFPAEFLGVPDYVDVSSVRSSNTGLTGGLLVLDPTSTGVAYFATSTVVGGSVRPMLTAIGRWY